MFIPVPAVRPNVSIYARWVPALKSFSTRICIESIFNNNTKMWSAVETIRMGDEFNEFPTVEHLIKVLDLRGFSDWNFINTHAHFIIDALDAGLHR